DRELERREGDDRGPRARALLGRPARARLSEPAERRRPCNCESYARVTERAALAGARWLGRADQEAAEEAAFAGARLALEELPISGTIVIGAPAGAEQLAAGMTIGAGGGGGAPPPAPPPRGARWSREEATTRSR